MTNKGNLLSKWFHSHFRGKKSGNKREKMEKQSEANINQHQSSDS